MNVSCVLRVRKKMPGGLVSFGNKRKGSIHYSRVPPNPKELRDPSFEKTWVRDRHCQISIWMCEAPLRCVSPWPGKEEEQKETNEDHPSRYSDNRELGRTREKRMQPYRLLR